MPPEPPLPAVVLARAVVADVEAQAAEPVAVVPVDLVQLRSPQFLVQLLLLEPHWSRGGQAAAGRGWRSWRRWSRCGGRDGGGGAWCCRSSSR